MEWITVNEEVGPVRVVSRSDRDQFGGALVAAEPIRGGNSSPLLAVRGIQIRSGQDSQCSSAFRKVQDGEVRLIVFLQNDSLSPVRVEIPHRHAGPIGLAVIAEGGTGK